MISADEVRTCCSDWFRSGLQPNGVDFHATVQLLLARGVRFHELGCHELMAACVGLTETLALPNFNALVLQDHRELWAWIAELVTSKHSSFFDPNSEQRRLFEATFRSALAEFDQGTGGSHDKNAVIFYRCSSVIVTYLSFPLTEYSLRRKCSVHLGQDGVVRQQFRVDRPDGSHKEYGVGARCNSIGDALLLLRGTCDQVLGEELDRFYTILARVTDGTHATKALFSWRNSTLHGDVPMELIGGAMLCLIGLLLVHEIGPDFERLRHAIVQEKLAPTSPFDAFHEEFYPRVLCGRVG